MNAILAGHNNIQSVQNTEIGMTNTSSFELALRAAKLLSSSNLVPKDYQGAAGLPNCVIALNMAHRMGADPIMIMQNLVPIHGRPSWSSQFLIATFNSCGRFTSIRFEFFGEPGTDSYGCRAYSTEKATGEKLVGTDVTIAIAKSEGWYGKTGSKWKTMPQQMLTYRAAAWFVRAYAPELSMGLHTQEEVIEITDYQEVATSSPTRPRIAKVKVSSIDEMIKQENPAAIEPDVAFNDDVIEVDKETGEIIEVEPTPVLEPTPTPTPTPVAEPTQAPEPEPVIEVAKVAEVVSEPVAPVVDKYADIKAQIKACDTKAAIGRLYGSLKEAVKAELKPFFQQRQDELNGVIHE